MGEFMYQLSDYVQIDKRFQHAVNLQLDLDNDEKLLHYIPTRSSILILKNYLETITGKNRNRATILIGPYGKGKSHLLLVLLRLIAKGKTEILEELIDRIEEVDSETADLAREIVAKKKPFLPVVVSSTEGDLNRAFLFALTESLEQNGLSDIAPDSFYKEAEKTILRWEQEFPAIYEMFQKKLKSEPVDSFMRKLHRMDQKTYEKFCEIYPLLTGGSSFQPMIQSEMLSIYKGVSQKLCETYHYAGIYLIFDEFSKYIEGHDQGTFARDMKIIQDVCELAASSKEQQIHITFVAHKSIKEYGNLLPKEIINAFTGVEGRLKEILFVVSSQNNYELIQNVIQKKDKQYQKLIQQNPIWKKTIQESYKLPCFESLFQKNDYLQIIGNGCFPMLPLTSYLLLGISEKVAQNERSIFTFLTGDEPGTLVSFLQENQKELTGIGADVIFDYFQSLFRENAAMTAVHSEWLKADYALNKTENIVEQRMIKVIALLLMLRRQDEIKVDARTISLALGLDEQSTTIALHNLCQKHLLVWRSKTGIFAFKNNVGIDLEKEIQDEMLKLPEHLNVCEVLETVSELEYVLPKQYNQEYTVTRYFRYEFMMEQQFLQIPKAEYLFEQKKADGKVLAILPEKEDMFSEICEKERELQDERILVIYPTKKFKQEKNIRKLLAVQKLKADPEFIENNKVLVQELELCEEDLIFEINAAIEQVYMPENQNCKVIHLGEVHEEFLENKDFNRFLSKICYRYYQNAPKINNEQINRQSITAQMKRARNTVLETILSDENYEKFERGTSPEATIFRATLMGTGILGNAHELDLGSQDVLKRIDEFIKDSEGHKNSFQTLYNIILGQGYGVRKGVIPIFIARKLAVLEDMPAIYLQDKEVELSVEVLSNINEAPEQYYLYVEKGTAAKERYLTELQQAFLETEENRAGYRKDQRAAAIVTGIQKWYRSLPQCTLHFKNCPDDLSEDQLKEIVQLRTLLRRMELNPREVLFERIPAIFLEEDYEKCVKALLTTRVYLDHYIEKLQKGAIGYTKTLFQIKKNESLSGVLKDWYQGQSNEAKDCLLSDRVSKFMAYLANINTHDETAIVNHLAKVILDLYIEDWNDASLEEFKKAFRKMKEEIEAVHVENADMAGRNKILFTDSEGNAVEKYYEAELDDSTSYFLKNAIEEAMEEFGDSLEMNQKVAVLVQTIEKLMK